MTSEEMNNILKDYKTLEDECKRIAKMYLDLSQNDGSYCGSVNSIIINFGANTFDFYYSPCSSGIGGRSTLSFNYVSNNGHGLKEEHDRRVEQARIERENRICKTCGHEKLSHSFGMFNP